MSNNTGIKEFTSSTLFHNITLPRARLSWPYLTKMDTNMCYSTKLVVDPDDEETMQILQQGEEEVLASAERLKLNITNSFVRVSEKDDWTQDHYIITAKRRQPVPLYDTALVPLSEQAMSLIYSGAVVAAHLLVRDYKFSGKRGFTVNLQGLMFYGYGDREAGHVMSSPASMFGALSTKASRAVPGATRTTVPTVHTIPVKSLNATRLGAAKAAGHTLPPVMLDIFDE